MNTTTIILFEIFVNVVSLSLCQSLAIGDIANESFSSSNQISIKCSLTGIDTAVLWTWLPSINGWQATTPGLKLALAPERDTALECGLAIRQCGRASLWIRATYKGMYCVRTYRSMVRMAFSESRVIYECVQMQI